MMLLHYLIQVFSIGLVLAQGDGLTAPPDEYSPREPDSPYSYPSPNATGQGEWKTAYLKAKRFVAELTIEEKVGICTGNGFPP